MLNINTKITQHTSEPIMQRQQNSTIYQWYGIQVPEELAEEYATVINKFVNGPRNGLDFECLHGYDAH